MGRVFTPRGSALMGVGAFLGASFLTAWVFWFSEFLLIRLLSFGLEIWILASKFKGVSKILVFLNRVGLLFLSFRLLGLFRSTIPVCRFTFCGLFIAGYFILLRKNVWFCNEIITLSVFFFFLLSFSKELNDLKGMRVSGEIRERFITASFKAFSSSLWTSSFMIFFKEEPIFESWNGQLDRLWNILKFTFNWVNVTSVSKRELIMERHCFVPVFCCGKISWNESWKDLNWVRNP